MKITKEEALALSKVLHHNINRYTSDESKSNHDLTLEELSARLDEYLVYGGDEEETEDEHECCDHSEEDEEDEEAEDDGDEEEDSSDEEDEEEDEEESDEESDSEDDESDESDEEELDVDGYVSVGDLHELRSVKSTNGSLEFESDEEDDTAGVVDVLLDGYHDLTITHLRRKGKELHVRDDHGEWHVYSIVKFPTAWVDLLPLNELVKIED